jgi:hypothetical protein
MQCQHLILHRFQICTFQGKPSKDQRPEKQSNPRNKTDQSFDAKDGAGRLIEIDLPLVCLARDKASKALP